MPQAPNTRCTGTTPDMAVAGSAWINLSAARQSLILFEKSKWGQSNELEHNWPDQHAPKNDPDPRVRRIGDQAANGGQDIRRSAPLRGPGSHCRGSLRQSDRR